MGAMTTTAQPQATSGVDYAYAQRAFAEAADRHAAALLDLADRTIRAAHPEAAELMLHGDPTDNDLGFQSRLAHRLYGPAGQTADELTGDSYDTDAGSIVACTSPDGTEVTVDQLLEQALTGNPTACEKYLTLDVWGNLSLPLGRTR